LPFKKAFLYAIMEEIIAGAGKEAGILSLKPHMHKPGRDVDGRGALVDFY